MILFGGTCLGLMFNGVSYYQAYTPGASKNGLDYVFSFGVGAYVTASVCGLLNIALPSQF